LAEAFDIGNFKVKAEDKSLNGWRCFYEPYDCRECGIKFGLVKCVEMCPYGKMLEVPMCGECAREFLAIVDPVSGYLISLVNN
jgi:hypothetical protein